MAPKNNKQPELYQPLTALATRDESRELAGKMRGREIYFADTDTLELRPGMNWRRKPDWLSQEDWEKDYLKIPELAADIYANNGPADPLYADHPKGSEMFQVTEGQRRMYAIRYNIKVMKYKTYPNGTDIRRVELLLNPKEFTDLERAKTNYTTQNKMPLNPLEMGQGFKEMAERHNMSQDQIAKHFGNMSRQFVTNMIALTELPVSVQIDIYNGVIPYSKALQEARKEKAVKKNDVNTTDNRGNSPGGDNNPGNSENAGEAGKTDTPQSPTTTQDQNTSGTNEVIPQTEKKAVPTGTVLGAQANEVEGSTSNPAPQPPDKIETGAAHDAEWNSRKTDGNYKEQRPSKDREDALPQQDYRNDKQEAEMNMNQIVGWLDKMETKLNQLPDLGGAKKDLLGLNGFIRKNVMLTIPLIKKAPDKGAE